MPQRPFEDKGVLRTDEGQDPSTSYQRAEKTFDPNDPPTTWQRIKGVAQRFRQKDQLRTTSEEDPSASVRDSYSDS